MRVLAMQSSMWHPDLAVVAFVAFAQFNHADMINKFLKVTMLWHISPAI